MAQQRPQKWLVRDQELPVGERVLLMAVLNLTPDSFSDGGRFRDPDHAVATALEMVQEGADLLDIGGESSRPGSHPVSLEEELDRVVPIVAKLVGRVPVPISVDTTKAEVARQCLDCGASVINDISALRNDPEMADVVSQSGAGLILMHMQGVPATMQRNPSYADVVEEVYDFLRRRTEAAVALGIDRDRIAVDPGIGFGKRLEDNLALLSELSSLTRLGRPIVIGPSRKGFLGALLQRPVLEREWGTAAAVAAAVLNGAHIVRVHAVPAMREVIRVTEAIRTAGGHSVPSEGLQKERS
jgi:dihydropteroate synthase